MDADFSVCQWVLNFALQFGSTKILFVCQILFILIETFLFEYFYK